MTQRDLEQLALDDLEQLALDAKPTMFNKNKIKLNKIQNTLPKTRKK